MRPRRNAETQISRVYKAMKQERKKRGTEKEKQRKSRSYKARVLIPDGLSLSETNGQETRYKQNSQPESVIRKITMSLK